LLKDFDILKQPSDGTMVAFDHVKLTAHDMLELYFTPVTKYPPINAIEVEPESQTIRNGTGRVKKNGSAASLRINHCSFTMAVGRR